jgi:two-component system LytT family response regulator
MMNKLKGIVIDDEKNGRDVIKSLVSTYCTDVAIVAEASNINDAFALINEWQPEFILLDIQMPGGNGFDLLKKFDKINFDIVFITSYDKYAVSAFKFSAVDYLLKPVEIDDLVHAIDKIKQKRINSDKEGFDKYNSFLNNVSNDDQLRNIALQKGDKVFYLKLSDIIYLEAESNYTRIVTMQSETFLQSKTLKYYEDLFQESHLFIRISRSHIINIVHVKSYSKSEPCILSLSNDYKIEISRRKKTELIALMDSL